MTDLRIAHEFDCDQDVFWDKIFFDEEFNRKLYLERLKFPVWRVVKQETRDGIMTRTLEIQPRIKDMPGPVLKIIGDKFGYVEEGTFDKNARRFKFRVIPSVKPDKTKVEGQVWTEAVAPGRTRRIVEAKIEISIFAVGGMMEQRTAEDTRKSYEVSAEFTRNYLKEKGLSTA